MQGKAVQDEIKVCPLCGGATLTRAEVIQAAHHSNLDLTIKCVKCGCRRTTTLEMLDKSFGEVVFAMHKAIDEWNRRADNDRQRKAD